MNEGDKITVSGTLERRFFYGPPGWGENKSEDKKIYFLSLKLDKLLPCINDLEDSDNWRYNVQLILSKQDYEHYHHFIKHHAIVTGSIMLAQTGYHITPVLLADVSIESDRKNNE
ncbi:TPA: DUF4431 domain-containing protein [Escherichia coli]|nr:DUF4431 domain-containing protein [Escherichia coli]